MSAVKVLVEAEVDTLARTLYGEARGEPVRGKEAVACVIINRMRKAQQHGRYWWGNSIGEVCLKRWQFSCWNQNDPNRAKILSVTRKDKVFASCLRIARRAMRGGMKDPTEGATHYHHEAVLPPWARGQVPLVQIGAHVFYKNIP